MAEEPPKWDGRDIGRVRWSEASVVCWGREYNASEDGRKEFRVCCFVAWVEEATEVRSELRRCVLQSCRNEVEALSPTVI